VLGALARPSFFTRFATGVDVVLAVALDISFACRCGSPETRGFTRSSLIRGRGFIQSSGITRCGFT
jgi:hypothetical protein